MQYHNGYLPPPPLPPVTTESELYEFAPSSSYDLNSILPVPTAQLETEKLRLEPLIPSLHAEQLSDAFMASSDDPNDVWFYPFPTGKPYTSKIETLMYLERQRRRPNLLSFAAIDQKSGDLAGVVALACDPFQITLDVKLMGIKIFPRFRGTFVFKHACFLLLSYTLNPVSEGGLGLVRVAWRTPPANIRSQKAALKLGLKREGTMRCYEVWKPDSTTYPYEDGTRVNDDSDRVTEDGVIFSMTIHDWLGGSRENLKSML